MVTSVAEYICLVIWVFEPLWSLRASIYAGALVFWPGAVRRFSLLLPEIMFLLVTSVAEYLGLVVWVSEPLCSRRASIYAGALEHGARLF